MFEYDARLVNGDGKVITISSQAPVSRYDQITHGADRYVVMMVMHRGRNPPLLLLSPTPEEIPPMDLRPKPLNCEDAAG